MTTSEHFMMYVPFNAAEFDDETALREVRLLWLDACAIKGVRPVAEPVWRVVENYRGRSGRGVLATVLANRIPATP